MILLLLCLPLVLAELSYESRLEELRKRISAEGLDGYIIPNSDYHGSEMTAERDKRRGWISGFTGSWGDAVVTLKEAALFTDSRYTIQAERQLSPSWHLPHLDINISHWISEKLKPGDRIGADPKSMPYGTWIDINTTVSKKGIELKETNNLIDVLWTDRPKLPDAPLFIHDVKYTGEDYPSKMSKLRQNMVDLNSTLLVLSSLDEIAWLLNLRGGDNPFTPFFVSFLILSQSEATLYVRSEVVTPEIRKYLNDSSAPVRVKEYEEFWSDWKQAAENCSSCFLPNHSSFYIYSAVAQERRVSGRSPVVDMRAYKNPTEVEGSRKAHISDAIALCKLFSILEEKINEKQWKETDVSELVTQLRKEQPENRGKSFPDIVASGRNAALPHYLPENGTDALVNSSAVLLLDTGGQYLGGTTDTTRVLHLGTPREEEIDIYTRLLKGVARLGKTVFPEGSSAKVLDSLVRAPLYEVGLSYGHGSTHGTGIYLSVHEEFNRTYYENFIGSQEPGFYEKDNFGMRLENLVVVVPAVTKYKGKTEKKLLKFSPLTLVPYERKMINASILDESELEWLNNYHKEVLTKVGDELLKRGDQKLFQWLTSKTEPILKK